MELLASLIYNVLDFSEFLLELELSVLLIVLYFFLDLSDILDILNFLLDLSVILDILNILSILLDLLLDLLVFRLLA